MPYDLCQWPDGVYPGELGQFQSPLADIDMALQTLKADGTRTEIYSVKNLGKLKEYLWQLNLRSDGQQIRILFAPYNKMIVVFLIHKKSSPEEQQRAYKLAMKRKRQLDNEMKSQTKEQSNVSVPRIP